MTVYIIADLHLSPDTPEINCNFYDFCRKLVSGDILYILGDFFGYFVEPAPDNSLHSKLRQEISTLTARNVKVYFMHGNRDFLMTKSMANYFGFTLIKDQTVLETKLHRILLLHGDELCTAHRGYTFFRWFSRNRLHQAIFFLFSTYNFRQNLAHNMRENSKRNFQRNNCQREDINQQAAIRMMNRYNCDCMIHGHTHNVSIKNVGGNIIYDTGDWRSNGYSYIKIENNSSEPQIENVMIDRS